MNQTHSKRTQHKHYLITIFTIFTFLFCCMGCAKKTPREALEDAYKKTFVKNNPTETVLGLSEITEKVNDNKAYSSGLSVSIQELTGEDFGEYAGLLSGLGFSVDSASDLLNRKSAGTVDITYGGTTYFTLGGQLQGSKLYLTSPQLLDGSLSVDFSTLKDDLNSDSMLAQLLKAYNVTLPENFSESIIGAFTSPASLKNLTTLTSAYAEFDKAIIVEQLDKKTVNLPADVSAKNVYSVTIPQYAYVTVIDAAIDALADYSSSLSSAIEENAADMDTDELKDIVRDMADVVKDIVLTVAVTKDGYISYAASEVISGTETFTLTATFTGEKNSLTDTNVVFDLTSEGETITIAYKESFDEKENEISFSTEITADGETMVTFSGEGSFSDIKKGEKYVLDFDYIELDMPGIMSVSLGGEYYIDTTTCEISEPTGTEHNLFRMSQQDFTSLAMEIVTNLQNDPLLSKLLESLDLGM